MTGFGEAHSQKDGWPSPWKLGREQPVLQAHGAGDRRLRRAGAAHRGTGTTVDPPRNGAGEPPHRPAAFMPGLPDKHRCAQSAILEQIEGFCSKMGQTVEIAFESLLPLPGVVNDQTAAMFRPDEDWPAISEVLAAALKNLAQMRVREGQAMADDLAANCRAIAAGVEEIERRAPRWWTPTGPLGGAAEQSAGGTQHYARPGRRHPRSVPDRGAKRHFRGARCG